MDPESWLGSLEPIGWRFGLDRIRRLLTALGLPQHRFASVHVVGTNGKSSVTAMTAALLEAHGSRTGAFLSPHDERWAQRIVIAGDEVSEAELARAAERVAAAIPGVERTLGADDFVTQFEAATATALLAFVQARVEVAVIEAGLGGRLDATNVLPSRVTALTSIGLEHTEYLGETEVEIAAEKLAVLRDHSVLVIGELSTEVRALAERTARERHARLIDASRPLDVAGLGDRAPYLARNLAVAAAAAEVIVGPLSEDLVEGVARSLDLSGRMQVVGSEPPIVLDAAHNPAGARALAEALMGAHPEVPVVACVAVLADKDAAGIVAALAPALDAIVCTEIAPERLRGAGRPGSESRTSGELARLAREAGIGDVEAEADAAAAVRRAIAVAKARGGVALLTGSHYLLTHGP